MILIESGVHFARPFVTPFNVINETAIRSLCGGKAESSGCLQIKSRLLTSRANRAGLAPVVDPRRPQNPQHETALVVGHGPEDT